MIDTIRKIFFVVAVVLVAVALVLELAYGQGWSAGGGPGLGVRANALLDCLLVFVVLLIALSLVLPERIHGRLQGIATLIVSIFAILASFAMLMSSLGSLIAMIALICAVPFGPLIYLAVFELARSSAGNMLALAMLLKLLFAGFLIAAQQRYLQNTGLVLLTVTSLLSVLIVSFLQNFVPGILAPVTDALGAIAVCILALLWGLWFLLRSLPSILKVLAVWRSA